MIGVLKNVVAVGDLISSATVHAEIVNATSRLITQISNIATCLYTRVSNTDPEFRLAWAEFLRGPGLSLQLQSLSILPNWTQQEYVARDQMQMLVNWLFQQIDTSNSAAVAFMSDVVRVCILLASHAPVNEIITSALTTRAKPIVGGAARPQSPVSTGRQRHVCQPLFQGRVGGASCGERLRPPKRESNCHQRIQAGCLYRDNRCCTFHGTGSKCRGLARVCELGPIMPGWFGRPQLAREDRYVQQCRVRGCGQTSRERISFLLEEALRLVSLPGEYEGRVYYLRKVVVSKLTTRASRQAWIDTIRAALMELASGAIHGADSRADAAEAVFFYNHEEALQLFLGRILRREPLDRWFWPLVNGTAVNTTRSRRVLAIVERLRDLPASWLAVADSVISAIGHSDPVPLLTLLPLAPVNSWLRELSARQIPFAWPRPVHLPQVLDVTLRRAIRAMGSDEPRVLWLAALADIASVPSEFNTGRVVYRPSVLCKVWRQIA